ncbi:MAG: hypothetical protein DME97_18430 [Verrucomicrobia bacterium]|nr:MAG: hypothetical protein DME97_18430 [Verrucomicrobiota bacterium]
MPSSSATAPPVRFGPFEVDLRAGELIRNGRRIRLQDQPLQVLAMLLERPGNVVTRDELRQKLWPRDTFVDFDHGLNNAINRLRDALNDSADTPRFIQTLPKRGYRFISQVESHADETGSATAQGTLLPWWRSPWAAFGTAALVLSLLLGFALSASKGRNSNGAHALRIASIAVLPLENVTGDATQDYLAEGMTDALTTELARVRALRVISHTAASRYNADRTPLSEIARELRVDAVVTGTVRRTGKQVQISAELIEAATNRQRWAKTYDRDVGVLSAVQIEVARDLARQMDLPLTPQETVRLSWSRSVSPEAFDDYLRAQSHVGKRDGTEASIRLLEKAVTLDPNFAAAHAALGSAYQRRGSGFEPQNREWEEKAFAAVQKALQLDPNLAEAYVARGLLLLSPTNQWAYERSVQQFRHALELNPSLAEAHHQLANVYNHVCLLDKAADEAQKAVALDPLHTGARFRVGINLLYQGRYEESLAAIRDAQRFYPSLWAFQTSFALFQLGRKEEAKQRVAEFLRRDPADRGGHSPRPHESARLLALSSHCVHHRVRLRPDEQARAGAEVLAAGRGRRVSVLHAVREGCQPGQPPKPSCIHKFHDPTEEAMGVLPGQALAPERTPNPFPFFIGSRHTGN